MNLEIDFDVHKYVPWYLPALVGEVLRASDALDLRRRLRAVLPELKNQALGYWENRTPYTRDFPAPSLGLHLHGGLDLFGDTGVCREFRCRFSASNRLVRSVGVFADVIWISDTLTWDLLDFGRATNERLHALAENAWILANIYPLIAAGIVRFRPSAFLACKGCAGRLEQRVDEAVDLVLPIFERSMSVHEGNGGFYLDTGNAYDPPLRVVYKGDGLPLVEQALKGALRKDLRTAIFVTQEIQLLGGALFSNSRIALSGLFALRKSHGANRDEIRRALTDGEGLDFPWINELNAAQVVELRTEASRALPAFREAMATVLAVRGTEVLPANAAQVRIDELRERSVAVREELQDISRSSERFWRTTYAVLGLSVSTYGLISQSPAAALGGLLPIIQNLLSHKSGLPKDHETLMRDPAFMFVKAQDLLAHG